MNPSFWKGRTVLVTGHTGFKGGWLSFWLTQMGADVVGYSLLYNHPSFYEICGKVNLPKSYYGNILDPDSLKFVMELHKPSVVFHMAAQAFVGESYREPAATFSTNVIGTANILDIIRQNNFVDATIVITSDKCYNNYISSIHKETDELGGDDPYSASKACAEMVVNAYRKGFSMHNLATVRAGNVIGGGDWGQARLVTDIVHAIINNETPELRSPSSIRPWQFILDVLSGYILLAEEIVINGTQYSGAWNFGPSGSIITTSQFLEEFLREWGYKSEWLDKSNEPQYKESKVLQLDCSKAKDILGWTPKLNFSQIIDLTVDWYKAYYSHHSMFEFTKRQIEYYMEL